MLTISRRFAAAAILLVLLAASRPAPADTPKLPPAPFSVAAPGSVLDFSKSHIVVGKPDGFSVHYTSNGEPRTANFVCGLYPLYVAPDETYVVRWTSRGEYRNIWEGTSTTWYAPSVGWIVKFEYSDNQGKKSADQLVRYELAR